MKNISNIIGALKLVAKYSAYVLVIVDVINFAIERFESIAEKEQTKESINEKNK